jgi:hypothetical protein
LLSLADKLLREGTEEKRLIDDKTKPARGQIPGRPTTKEIKGAVPGHIRGDRTQKSEWLMISPDEKLATPVRSFII